MFLTALDSQWAGSSKVISGFGFVLGNISRSNQKEY